MVKNEKRFIFVILLLILIASVVYNIIQYKRVKTISSDNMALIDENAILKRDVERLNTFMKNINTSDIYGSLNSYHNLFYNFIRLIDEKDLNDIITKALDFGIVIVNTELKYYDDIIEVDDKLVLHVKYDRDLYKLLKRISRDIYFKIPGEKDLDISFYGMELQETYVEDDIKTYVFNVENEGEIVISDYAKEVLGLKLKEIKIRRK